MPATAATQRGISLASGYTSAGPFDELMAGGHVAAAHWSPLLASLEAYSHEQRLERIERINMRVRETGIAHDLFADPSRNVQPWRLDLMPVLLPPAEWARIETAVVQRARLIELLLADIYGPQRLMKRGLVPPTLVFADSSFLRAVHGLAPTAARLQFLAVDLARGPAGSWRIVDTHTETPAGIGYALANRTVLTHVCGDIFSASRALRLAPYFQRMQDALASRVNRADPSAALLTPGPHHNDFFSHAYLARYLGMLLVESEDLRVEDGRVFLKTLDGLQPIDAIVRCVAGSACDALELDPGGFLGPVGLVQAVRRQPDIVVNALGTAIAENRGLGPYLPELARELLGESLVFPDTEKLWLGDANARRQAVQSLDSYFIRRAFEETARPGRAAAARDPAKLSGKDRMALIEEIELGGACLIAEEKVPLGTSPSYGPRGLEPKPFAMRVFATATPDGFIVMPGGLAMTVDPGASMALTAPEGESRDVWVQSNEPQPPFKSLWRPVMEAAEIQRGPREFPSRTADNLFWLGRYVEHADWTFRVLRNCLSRIEEDSGPRQSLRLARSALCGLLERDRAAPVRLPEGLDEPRAISALANTLMTSLSHDYGLPRTLDHIHRVAGLTRDRLSQEAWRTLNAFHTGQRWRASAFPTTIGEQLDLIDAGLGVIAAFNGLSHENMTRNHGWSFLDMGRRIARAYNLADMLASAFSAPPAVQDDAASLLFVLELADSFITYRSRYRLDPALPLVLDLLIIDETNPRSIAFQLASIAQHIDTLPRTGKGRGRTDVQRRALSLVNDVRLADVGSLSEPGADGCRAGLAQLLETLTEGLPQLSDAITRRYFSVVEKGPQWVRAQSRRTQ